jgi:hypothetical protein
MRERRLMKKKEIKDLGASAEPEPPKKRIGFLVEEPHVLYKSSKGSKKQRIR